MSTTNKPRHKRFVDDLITFAEWQTERTFTYRLRRIDCYDAFLQMIGDKYGDNCALSFEDWHIEEEVFFDKKLTDIANNLWNADNNCPELIKPDSEKSRW